MLELITGDMPDEAKKMLWQAHGLRWRNELGAALLRDGECYAWAGLDTTEPDGYFAHITRNFGPVFSDIPQERWSEIQDWGTYVIFDWIFNDLKAKRIHSMAREHSSRSQETVARMRNGQWTDKTWECRAEDVLLRPVPKPDFV